MKKDIAALLVLISLASLSFVCDFPAIAQTSRGYDYTLTAITINPNGEVTPSNASILKDGNLYTLTADITDSITIERGGILLDGAGYTLRGYGDSAAVNIIASNVIVENICAINWKTGILGTYNNNTIANCELAQNPTGIAIYANDYVVVGNNVSGSRYAFFIKGGAIRPQGDSNVIMQNQVVGNNIAFDILDSNGTTIVENTVENNSIILEWATSSSFSEYNIFFANNFINNSQVLDTGAPVDTSPSELLIGRWDNGTMGNYWSDYSFRYANATELDHSGIGDTPYIVIFNASMYVSAFNRVYGGLRTVIDHFPLMAPVNVSASILNLAPTTNLPLPTALPGASPSPKSSPLQTPSPSPFTSPATEPTSSNKPISTVEPTPSQSFPPSQEPTSSTDQHSAFQEAYYAVGLAAVFVIVAVVALILKRPRRLTR